MKFSEWADYKDKLACEALGDAMQGAADLVKGGENWTKNKINQVKNVFGYGQQQQPQQPNQDEQQDAINQISKKYASKLMLNVSDPTLWNAVQEIARAKIFGGQRNTITMASLATIMDALIKSKNPSMRGNYITPWGLLTTLSQVDDAVERENQWLKLKDISEPGQGGWQIEYGFTDWNQQISRAGGYARWKRQYGHGLDEPEQQGQQGQQQPQQQQGANPVTAAVGDARREANIDPNELKTAVKHITDDLERWRYDAKSSPADKRILHSLIKWLQSSHGNV